jgi:hypothetical protein
MKADSSGELTKFRLILIEGGVQPLVVVDLLDEAAGLGPGVSQVAIGLSIHLGVVDEAA